MSDGIRGLARMVDGAVGERPGQGSDERDLEVARQMGEYGARIGMLERRFETELGHIRDALNRIEAQRVANVAPSTQPDPNLMLAVQGINRMADAMKDVVKATPSAPVMPMQMPQNVSPFNPVAVLGYVIGSLALAWAARGFFPGV